MAFSEKVKLQAKRKSHFQCCICKEPFVEVHHINPQKDGGSDDLENAAPLCASCHDRYGGNPEKKKQIREMRDLWWEICETRYYDTDRKLLFEKLDGISAAIEKTELAKESQLEQIRSAYLDFHKTKVEKVQASESLQELSSATGISSFASEITICPKCSGHVHPTGPRLSSDGLVMWYRCSKCGTSYPGFEEWDG